MSANQRQPRLEDLDWSKARRTEGGSALRRAVADPLVALAGTGTLAAGEAAVGLADIPTLGYAGKALESIGYDPAQSKRTVNRNLLSLDQQLANQRVEDAQGFVGTAKTMLQNPSTIIGAALESLPSTFGGGAIGQAVRKVAPRLPAIAAAGIGEGAVSAGASAEGIRQQTADGLLGGKQALSALGAGGVTGLLGAGGGALGRKLGIADIDTALVQGALGGARRSLPARVAGGALTEGVLEELPQSVQEQLWENYALDRPLPDNVGKAAAQGMLAGAAMGAGANLRRGRAPQPKAGDAQDAPIPADSSAARERLALPPPPHGMPPYEPFHAAPHPPAPPAGPIARAAQHLPALHALETLGQDGLQGALEQEFRQGEVLPPQTQPRAALPYAGEIIEGEFSPLDEAGVPSPQNERTYKGLPAANKAKRESGRADALEAVKVAPQTFALRAKAAPDLPALPAPQQDRPTPTNLQATLEAYRDATMTAPAAVRWDALPPAQRAQLRGIFQDGFDARALGERGEPPAQLDATQRKLWIAGAIEHDLQAPQHIGSAHWKHQAALRREQQQRRARDAVQAGGQNAGAERRAQAQAASQSTRQAQRASERQGILSDDQAQRRALDRWRHASNAERAQMLEQSAIDSAQEVNLSAAYPPGQHLPALAAGEKAAFAERHQSAQEQQAQEERQAQAWKALGSGQRRAVLERLGEVPDGQMEKALHADWADFSAKGRQRLREALQAGTQESAQESAPSALRPPTEQRPPSPAKAPEPSNAADNASAAANASRQLAALEKAAAAHPQVAAAVREEYRTQWPDRSEQAFGENIARLITDIGEKDVGSLRSWIAAGYNQNPRTARIFEKVTGIELPPAASKRRVLLDQWAGISPGQRAEMERQEAQGRQDKKTEKAQKAQQGRQEAQRKRQAENQKARQEGQHAPELEAYLQGFPAKRRAEAEASLRRILRDGSGTVATLHRWVEKQLQEGAPRIGRSGRHFEIGDFRVPKAAYDYAQYLQAQQQAKASAPQAPPVKPGYLRPIPLKLEGWTGSTVELAKLARQIYTEELQGQTVENASLGARIAFTSEGKGEAFGARGRVRSGIRAELVRVLKELVQSAVKVSQAPPSKGRASDSKAFHTLVNALAVDGQVIPVRLTVREALQGEPAFTFYDVATKERSPVVRGLQNAQASVHPPFEASQTSLAELAAAFNNAAPPAKAQEAAPERYDILSAPLDEEGHPSASDLDAFVQQLPASEREGISPNGGYDPEQAQRLFRAKLLQRAYGDGRLAQVVQQLPASARYAPIAHVLDALALHAAQAAALQGTPYNRLRDILALAAKRASAAEGQMDSARNANPLGSGDTLSAQAHEALGAFARDYANDALEAADTWLARTLSAVQAELQRAELDERQGALLGKRPLPTLRQVLQRLHQNPVQDYAKRGERPNTPPQTQGKVASTREATLNQGAIEDFGEKLGGARKDLAASLRAGITAGDLRATPFAKLWPLKEIDALEDKETAAAVMALRASVIKKPTRVKGDGLFETWALEIKQAREKAALAVKGDFARAFEQNDASYTYDWHEKHHFTNTTRAPIFAHALLLRYLPREQWRYVESVPVSLRGLYAAKVGADKVLSRGDESFEYFSGRVREKIEKKQRLKPLKFGGWSNENGEFWISKDGDKARLIQFGSREEMRAFQNAEDAHEKLVELWEAHKKRNHLRKEQTRGSENRERQGNEWRSGKDITPERFSRAFGFRGVEFGNWVNKTSERQNGLNRAYDALMDLAQLLGVPPRALSLAGKLGLAFGARGNGKANAHYETAFTVINLTKTRGAGTLAHEWFHALDNYFSRQAGADGFATKGDFPLESPVRPEVKEAFKAVVERLAETGMAERSLEADRGKEGAYWSQQVEIAARSFESYVIAKLAEQGQHNDYLANVSAEEDFELNPDLYVYPTASELTKVKGAFDKLFSTLQTREDDKGNSVLFSRSQQERFQIAVEGTRKAEAEKVLSALAGKALRNKETGIEALINSTQAGKLLNNAAVQKSMANGFTREQHYAIAAKIASLWESAIQFAEQADKNGHPDLTIKRFVAPLSLGGKTHYAAITVKAVVQHGHRVYSLEAHAEKTLRGMLDKDSSKNSAPNTPSRSVDSIIEALKALVNPPPRRKQAATDGKDDRGLSSRQKGGEALSQQAKDKQREVKPVASITGEEIATDLSPENVIERARQWFKENLQGKTVEREGLSPVRISGKGWNKLKNGLKADLDKARLIPAIPDIIQAGEYLGRVLADKARNDGIVAFHHFQAPLSLNGEIVTAGVSVAEDSRGNLFYNLNRDPQALLGKRKGSTFTREAARGAEPLKASEATRYDPAHKADVGTSESALSRSLAAAEDDVNLKIADRSSSAKPQPLSARQKGHLERARAVVSGIRKAWAHAPEVVVVHDLNDAQVPEAARRENARQGSNGAAGNPEGFFYQGKVYLLASALKTQQDVARVLFHETLGHFGLRGHFGAQLDGVLNGIASLRQADVKAKLKQYGLADTEQNRLIAAEEFLAEMAQTRPQLGWVQRAVAAIRTWLRQHVPALQGLLLTNNEIIQNYLLPARRFVEQGLGVTQGNATAAFARGKDSTAQWPFDLDNLPPMREARTFREAREAAKAFQGKPLTNKSTGMVAAVSRNNLDKMLSASAIAKSESPAIHSRAVANADALFERAVLGWSKPDRAGDPSIKAIHRFFSPMEVKGRIKMVKLTVKEVLNSGNNIYTLEAVDFDDGGQNWLESAAQEDSVSLGKKIPQRGEWVVQGNLIQDTSPELTPRGSTAQDSTKLAAEAVFNLAQAIAKRNQWPADEPPPLFSRSDKDSATEEALRKLGLLGQERQSLREKIKALQEGGLQEWLKAIRTRAEEGLFDGLLGIKNAERAAGIEDAQRQGYSSARLASGLADVVHAVLHYGAPQWKDGVIARKQGTRGLLDILGDIGAKDLNNWLGWLGGKRAELLAQQGRENNLSQADIAELLALGNGKEALYERVYREYAAANEAVLDVAQQAGLIDAAQRKAWFADYYVPFYRMDEADVFNAPSTRRGLSHQSAAIRALKGGKLPTQNLLSNILTAWTTRLDASLKNKALLDVVDNLKDSDYLRNESLRWKPVIVPRAQVIQKMKQDSAYLKSWAQHMGLAEDATLAAVTDALGTLNTRGFESFFSLQAPTDPEVIRVQRGGQHEYWRVRDESLLRGLKFVTQSSHNDPFSKMGRAFKRLLTTGVTASPDFILRNFLRDSAHTWAINRDGFAFAKDSLKGLKQAWVEDEDYRSLMFAGASFQGGYVLGSDPEAAAQMVRRALAKKGFSRLQQESYLGSLVKSPSELLKAAWEGYRGVGDKVENANRLAGYKAALAAGKSAKQAAFEAKDLMDFSLRGNFAAAIWFTDMIPFLNARLQGLYKLGRAISGEQPTDKGFIAREVAIKGAYLALFSLLLAGANGDDERYKALKDWDKDANWHFWFSADQTEPIRIPKPFEIGLLFGTLPERLFHALSGQQSGADLARALYHGVVNTLEIQPVPQFVRPLGEVWANRNAFFDTPIESLADAGKLKSARYDERTSALGKTLGQATGPLLNLSPKQLDHLLRGYAGTLGGYVLSLSNLVAMAGEDAARPALAAGDVPLLGVLYKGGRVAPNRYREEFYDLLRETQSIQKTVQAYRAEGRYTQAAQLASDNRDLLARRKALSNANRQLSAVRARIKALYRDPQHNSREKRAELNRLQTQANEIAQRAVRIRQALGGEQP